MVSSRSLLRYPGGKFRAREILYKEMPKNIDTVLSPFLGGGSFELFLTSKNINVTASDNFYELMIFWKVLLSDPDSLYGYVINYVGNMDKNIFNDMKMNIIYKKYKNDIELAGNFFIVNRCSFSGATLSGGFSKDASINRFNDKSASKIKEFQNNLLDTKCLDYDVSINNNTADLVFLDPPYLLGKSGLYGINGDKHKDFDHFKFFNDIKDIKTRFIITYNKNDDIEKLWKDFNIIDTSWKYGMNKSKESSEIIIKNF